MVVETMGVKAEGKEVNADSSMNDILSKAASMPETPGAEGAGSPPADEQAAEGAEESGKDVKTKEPEVADEDVDAGLEEGQPIPYDRFKKVNEERKAAKSELESFKKKVEEAQELFSDPDVLRAIRKKQGYTDEAIAEELKEMGVEEKVEKQGEPDTETVEGWFKEIDRRIDERLGKEVNPIKKTLTEAQQKEQMATLHTRLETEGKEAEKLAKDVYGLEYGDEKDAKDPTTAVGKMFNYLQKYPQKASLVAQGFLSKSDLLRLAVAEDGVKLGEKKGEAKAKERTEKVKSAQMEGDAGTGGADAPTAESSTQAIAAYMKAHPNWHP